MKILTVIGARPQFIKAGVVSRALKECDGISESIIHTGQHYDKNMSNVFFEQLKIPAPDFQLNVDGKTHGAMTGQMLEKIEEIITKERPDRILVYGDTNSTLAGALAGTKQHVPIAHVEAGLRSFNMKMPEEVNRILTDQVSDVLFCPTQTAVMNLKEEGFEKKNVKICKTGDVMQDSALLFSEYASAPSGIGSKDRYVLATLHRAENTDDPDRLKSIVSALNYVHREIAQVILPIHPRTKAAISRLGLCLDVIAIDPVGYFEMIWLVKNSRLVLTDSGGVQKEAFFFGKACVTMRDQTEWLELVEVGANFLVGADSENILYQVGRNLDRQVKDEKKLYGGGNASQEIASILVGL